jgi:hypothetical protein
MKTLFEFELTETIKADSGETKEKKHSFAVLKPNTTLRESGEVFHAKIQSALVSQGVLTGQMLRKRLMNDGGVLSEKEAQEIADSYSETQNVSQAYNISAKPIEIKTSSVNKKEKTAEPIVINRKQTSVIPKQESKQIEIVKPVNTTKVSQYTQPIDFLSINNNKTEILDTKLQNKILNSNSVNLSKISTDVNQFINNTKLEFRQRLEELKLQGWDEIFTSGG